MVKVDSVDLYYLSMPEVLNVGDGSQDVLLVRVRASEWEGWGECEASPLTSIASYVAPMSHSACRPVWHSVIGERLESIDDVRRINQKVRENSYDQLQAPHTLSGIDIALCDLLGRRFEVPVHQLLGASRPTPKTPYASSLFGATPEVTLATAKRLREQRFGAVKFGWMGFGADLAADRDQLAAAREGLGDGIDLLVDAGMAWSAAPAEARKRLPLLAEFGVRFVEEPFVSEQYDAYRAFGTEAREAGISLAGGEGCHNVPMALAMMSHAALDYVQIDTGRIGGITSAEEVAREVRAAGKAFVNHTFTSHLALSASLQPFADHPAGGLCEYPVGPRDVSYLLTDEHLEIGADGLLHLPEAPGLGLRPSATTMKKYLQEVEIRVNGQTLYETPDVDVQDTTPQEVQA